MHSTAEDTAAAIKQKNKKPAKTEIPFKKLKSETETNDAIDSSSLLKAIDEGMLTETVEKEVFIKKLKSRIQ